MMCPADCGASVAVSVFERVTLIRGVLGFARFADFTLAEIDDAPPFLLLESSEDPDVSFILLDPTVVDTSYAPRVPGWAMAALDCDRAEQLRVLCLVTLDDQGGGTINLRAPLVFKPDAGRGLQVVLEDAFPLRHPVSAAGST